MGRLGSTTSPEVIERVSTRPVRLVLELMPREWKRLRQVTGGQAAADIRRTGVPNPLYSSSSSNALASMRSPVSKPSANQP
jgi:hypothetical protein